MTGVALGLAMFALQGVVGILVMIEVDLLPSLVAMTGFALGTVASLVPLILIDLLVATVTGQRGLLVGLVLVALLALNVGVLAANQRELGLFVIETGFRPLLLVVAVLAFATEIPLMPLFIVDFLVTVVA